MAALGRTGGSRLRLCGQRRFLSMAGAARRPPPEGVGGAGTAQSLNLHAREFGVLLGFGSSEFRRTPRTSLYSTEASPDYEDAADNFLIDPSTSQETYTARIGKLCKDGNLSSVPRLLVTLRDKGIGLGLSTYSLILAAASEKSDIHLSCEAFKHLVVSHESLSSASYLNLAKAFLKASDCIELLRFVKEVSELAFPRSTLIVNRIILSFAGSRQSDKALFIFNNMKTLDCKPDLITCNTILDMLGCAGRVDEMFNKFDAMKEAGILPDIITYNTLLNSLRKVGRVDMCESLLKEMETSGIEPDLLTYTALIETFGRSGNVDQSLTLFNEMKLRQVRPSVYIYKSLISNLKKMGKVELATTLSEKMESPGSELAGPEDFKSRRNR